ncbi:serine/threonine-protein kinase VRK1 [Rhipicephalus sanguineus]|uniref:Uncharacterized protein n=1 Tax=Rhipicephalus sanguineus TaxID=34632 RepID=A0A9D4PAR3_RHISA|nr:serine/threonine-protein kinase VRK1 [Rhipicephalus sanguineus]KAH7931768.1 hypothetical protein HPB52_025371 [Rhipicephalus sanguineus]
MLMDRFGQYLQNILDRQGKTLSLKHAFSIIMPVLECFHSYEYIHTYADMKASWVPHCFSKNNENKLYRQDFGFIYRCTENGKRKEYEDDWRKAHDGTIEFTGPHNHTGAHSRRGDADLLGFNVFQWLCCQLLWEDDLKNPEYVSQQKKAIVENIPLLMIRCFQHGDIPCGITEFLQHVYSVKFKDTEDYKRQTGILEKSIQAAGFKPSSRLVFMPPRTQRRKSFSPKKYGLQEITFAEDNMGDSGNEMDAEELQTAKVATTPVKTPLRKSDHWTPAVTVSASCLDGVVELEPKKNVVSSLSGWTSSEDFRKNGFCEDSKSPGLDNPNATAYEHQIGFR